MLENARFTTYHDMGGSCMIYTIEVPIGDLVGLDFTFEEREKLKAASIDETSVALSEVLDCLKLVVEKIEKQKGQPNG